MGLVNATYAREVDVTLFKALAGFLKAQPWIPNVRVIKSTVSTKTFNWMGDHEGVKEFKDEKKVYGFLKKSFTVIAREWEKTISVSTKDLKQQAKLIRPGIENMGYLLANHPNGLFYTKMASGDTDLCYDGQALYSASHPIDNSASVNSNLITGTGTSVAQIKADWDSSMAAMMNLTNRAGEPIFDDVLNGTYEVHCAVALYPAMREIFITKPVGTENPYHARATVKVTGRLTGNDWYITRTDLPLKAFMLLEIDKFTTFWDEKDAKMLKVVYYGADAEYDIAPYYWQLTVKVNN